MSCKHFFRISFTQSRQFFCQLSLFMAFNFLFVLIIYNNADVEKININLLFSSCLARGLKGQVREKKRNKNATQATKNKRMREQKNPHKFLNWIILTIRYPRKIHVLSRCHFVQFNLITLNQKYEKQTSWIHSEWKFNAFTI